MSEREAWQATRGLEQEQPGRCICSSLAAQPHPGAPALAQAGTAPSGRAAHRMASLMTSGYCSGTERSSAASISCARSFMYALKSKLAFLAATAASGRADTSAAQRTARCGAEGRGRREGGPGDLAPAGGGGGRAPRPAARLGRLAPPRAHLEPPGAAAWPLAAPAGRQAPAAGREGGGWVPLRARRGSAARALWPLPPALPHLQEATEATADIVFQPSSLAARPAALLAVPWICAGTSGPPRKLWAERAGRGPHCFRCCWRCGRRCKARRLGRELR